MSTPFRTNSPPQPNNDGRLQFPEPPPPTAIRVLSRYTVVVVFVIVWCGVLIDQANASRWFSVHTATTAGLYVGLSLLGIVGLVAVCGRVVEANENWLRWERRRASWVEDNDRRTRDDWVAFWRWQRDHQGCSQ